ncbi:MAG: hypothetical protein ABL989_11195 [Gammaproteobacteria bacterium]
MNAQKGRKGKTVPPASPRQQSESRKLAMAQTALRPTVQAAPTVWEYDGRIPDLDLLSLAEGLSEQVSLAKAGDLSRAEAMLVTQAHTLDAIFHSSARRAAANMGEYVKAADTYLRLALKAQSQCRTTWETLALIKNPPHVAFVKQANIAHGPQQINNGPVPERGSRARETEIERNKLLEATDGERLDPGTAGAAGGADTHLETVGAINRPKDHEG